MSLEFRANVRGSQRLGVRLPQAASYDRPVGRGPRAPLSVPAVAAAARPASPVRLRYLLLIGAVGLGLNSLIPRVLAYWQLHDAATEFANYALCMVGPTGPELLRHEPGEFWRLVRRRLVAAPRETRPFAACTPSPEAFSEAVAHGPAHQARAEEFGEYAALAVKGPASLSLRDLRVTDGRLQELARAARPFAAADYSELIVASRTARGVAYPVALPRPALGHGLPPVDLGYSALNATEEGYLLVTGRDANLGAYRSRDGGTSWAPVDADRAGVRDAAGRCSVGGVSAPAFRLSVDAEQLWVQSWRDGERETNFPLAPADSRLLGFACDREAALAIVSEGGQARPVFRLCPHLGRCRDLNAPTDLVDGPGPDTELSVARVRGVAVIAMAHLGIVRVVSSRDDGETWTPSVVAYDAGDSSAPAASRSTPWRLLGLDGRVLLYAGSEHSDATYPVLVSDDYGASWQTR
jgi:hypothetical protein